MDPWIMEFWQLGYRIPFRWTPALSKEPIPYSLYSPTSIRGKALEGGGSLVVRERSDRAGYSSFSGLLQPAVCGDKGFRVVEAGHRPLTTGSDGSEDFFQDGDSLVCSSLGAERGLDGV